MKERNYSIDFMKGILILSVVAGHVLLGDMRESFPRYMIYSVHMPLFMGISGYLINFDKLINMRFMEMIKKYFFRVGIPWILAVNVYFVLTTWVIPKEAPVIGWELLCSYMESYVTPYYHLWYVEKFLVFVCLTWILGRLLQRYLADSGSVCTVLGITAGLIGGAGMISQFYEKRMYYYMFFILGMMGKDIRKKIRLEQRRSFVKAVVVCSALAVCIRIGLFFSTREGIRTLSWYFLNISLLILMILCCEAKSCPRCRLLEFLGKESLAVYLWHVLGRLWVISVFGSEDVFWYYFANILVLALEILLIYLGKKVKAVDKYLFGNVNSAEGRPQKLS